MGDKVDVTRLSETLSWLRSDEKSYQVQAKLGRIQVALQTLANSPGNAAAQVDLSAGLEELKTTLTNIVYRYDPAEIQRIIGVGGGPYFTPSLVDGIQASISQNPMTPATVLADVEQLVKNRKEFIDRVVSTEKGVDSFIPFTRGLEGGQADVGFEIPRSIFDNDFADFIGELRTLNRVIRVFSEVTTGSISSIKLGPISSSDPIIFYKLRLS